MVNVRHLAVVALFLIGMAGCATTEDGAPVRDFELYGEGQELEFVDVDPDQGFTQYLEADRNRIGGRFAFGPESVQGFFHVFKEDWEFTDLRGVVQDSDYDNWGIGGGVKGAPVVGTIGEDVQMVIPYRADLSYVWGENSHDSSLEMSYVDLHMEAGFGIVWNGLRPSVGLASSFLVGEMTGPGPDADLYGDNYGVYLDVTYQLPDYPLYGHIRAMGGEYRMLVLGIGARF